MQEKFLNFINALKNDKNNTLIESIIQGYQVLENMNTLTESSYLAGNEVPNGIRSWVNGVLGKSLQQYKLEQKGNVSVDMPWHEGDRTYYQLFQLTDNNDAKIVPDVHFQRSGLEGDGVMPTGKLIGGDIQIPSGYILAVAGTYPQRCQLYTADDAAKMLPPSDKPELTDTELVALYQAKSLIASYRTKWKQSIYDSLVEKGLMKPNKSITIKGKNLLPEYYEKLREIASRDGVASKYSLYNIR